MTLSRPRSAPAPFYETVKREISEKIASGVWQPHDRIPSEAELVAQYGFSRMTINRALRELTDEGMLVRLQGWEPLSRSRKASPRCLKFAVLPTKLPHGRIDITARC